MSSWGTQNQLHPLIKSSTSHISMPVSTRLCDYTRLLPWDCHASFPKEGWKFAVGGTPKGRSCPSPVTRYIAMLRYGVPTLKSIGVAVSPIRDPPTDSCQRRPERWLEGPQARIQKTFNPFSYGPRYVQANSLQSVPRLTSCPFTP